jgi:hypothetical protein
MHLAELEHLDKNTVGLFNNSRSLVTVQATLLRGVALPEFFAA